MHDFSDAAASFIGPKVNYLLLKLRSHSRPIRRPKREEGDVGRVRISYEHYDDYDYYHFGSWYMAEEKGQPPTRAFWAASPLKRENSLWERVSVIGTESISFKTMPRRALQ